MDWTRSRAVTQQGRYKMQVSEINELIFEGDVVIDRLDNSRRVVSGFVVHDKNDASVLLEDGGALALSEVRRDDIRLESEVYGDDEVENPTSQGPHNDSSWDYHYG